MSCVFRRFHAFFALILLFSGPLWHGSTQAFSQAKPATSTFDTIAKQALLFDFDTRSVLFERNADAKIAPASLVKLMTTAIVFRELKQGRLLMEGDMVVSADAWRRGGAVSGSPNMLLTPNRVIKVSELVTGLLVGAANDAALTLAENIAGTEQNFTAIMNEHARALGLTSLVFKNATGFLMEGQEGSLRDYVRLAVHLITNYPDLYALFAQKDMPLGKNRQVNRNPLLALDIGADGLITGTVPEVGHLIIGSAVQEGRRLIVALAGVETVQERSIEARKLLEWGFRRFEAKTLVAAGRDLGEVSVYGGAQGSVTVRTHEEIRLPVLRGSSEATSLRLIYKGPVPAPITEGSEIARLEIMIEGRVVQNAPLFAAHSVPVGSVAARAQDAALELSRQWTHQGFRWLLDKAGLSKDKLPPRTPQASESTGSLGKPEPTTKTR